MWNLHGSNIFQAEVEKKCLVYLIRNLFGSDIFQAKVIKKILTIFMIYFLIIIGISKISFFTDFRVRACVDAFAYGRSYKNKLCAKKFERDTR